MKNIMNKKKNKLANNFKNIINLLGFVSLISSLCIINRFIYHYFKNNDTSVNICLNFNCKINLEITIFSITLLVFILIMVFSYFIYNPSQSFPEEENILNYTIEKKEHSTMLWGVVGYPLILCPLSSDLYLFILTVIIIIGFTTIYLRHLNELLIPPLVIIGGEKMYLFTEKTTKDKFYLLSTKTIEELKSEININKIEILNKIFKEAK